MVNVKFHSLLVSLATSASVAYLPPAHAAKSSVVVDSSLVTPVADGCGPNGWRGRWGHCHYGRGWYVPPPVYVPPVYVPPGYVRAPVYTGCPPGYGRGPWGHCRNTPYHGPLPDGGWK